MKLSNPLIFCLSILFLISCGSDPDEQEMIVEEVLTSEQQELIDAINAEAFSFDEKPLQIFDSKLSFLEEISDARIIGLGEATHGTKEFFQMKHRIFQYMVEKHGFKAFVFEMDMAEARIFNDWVQHRTEGDIAQLMREKMFFWTWRTTEVRDLLAWMRTYNNGKEEVDMIGFYGVDTQTTLYNRDALVDIILKVDTEVANVISERTGQYMNLGDLYSENLSEELAEGIRTDILFVKQEVENLYPKILETLGEKEALWAKRLIRNMEQVELFTYNFQNEVYYHRDLFMAENTSWIFDLLGQDAQLVLWAHNAHLANDLQYGGSQGGSQGSYLKELYNDDYQIIGFTFSTGSFTAVRNGRGLQSNTIVDEPITGSLNWLFSKSDPIHFAIKTSPENPVLNNWFYNIQNFMMLGAAYNGRPSDYYRSVPLQKYYDYFIHVERTDNSDLL